MWEDLNIRFGSGTKKTPPTVCLLSPQASGVLGLIPFILKLMSTGEKLLEQLSEELRKGNKQFTVQFPMSRDSTLKAEALKSQGRDFFQQNKVMEDKMSKAMEKELSDNPEIIADTNGIKKLLQVGAEAAKDLIIDRLQSGGSDVSMKPLKQSTINAKGSSKVGINTGALLSDVKRTKPRVTD